MIRIDGNSRRQRFALETDLLSGNHTGCSGCGVSVPLPPTNLNTFVKYEGKLILVEGVQFSEHPNLSNPCCVGHIKVARAESSPPRGSFPTDNKIKINGIAPIRIGDITTCGSSVIPGVASPN
jgi:hypothetical protein